MLFPKMAREDLPSHVSHSEVWPLPCLGWVCVPPPCCQADFCDWTEG